MVMTAKVPTPEEAITAIIIIVTLLYPNLLADLSRPPQALAPPTAWNPSGFFEPSEGAENGAAFAVPIGVIAAQPVIRLVNPRRKNNWRACIMDFRSLVTTRSL
jgi:hypothetical protein